MKAMNEVAKKVNIGDASDAKTYLGPLQNKVQYDKVNRFIEEAQQYAYSTTESLSGMSRVNDVNGTSSAKEYCLNPRVLDNPSDGSPVVKAEQMVRYPFSSYLASAHAQ
jgi:acyl-CoA reductase-like NAD-dependent aldehyde dehydrogenase